MRRSGKLALSGLLTALSLVVMLLTVFQSAVYALPALAGVILLPATLENGPKWGAATYASAALLSLLLTPSLEAKCLFITFFGYYPLVKTVLERRCPAFLAWILKLALFNGTMIGSYALLIHVFGLSTDSFTLFGISFMWGFLLVGNGVFWLFDRAVSGLIQLYFLRLHPVLSHLFHRH